MTDIKYLSSLKDISVFDLSFHPLYAYRGRLQAGQAYMQSICTTLIRMIKVGLPLAQFMNVRWKFSLLNFIKNNLRYIK